MPLADGDYDIPTMADFQARDQVESDRQWMVDHGYVRIDNKGRWTTGDGALVIYPHMPPGPEKRWAAASVGHTCTTEADAIRCWVDFYARLS